jgi:diguanylate cyclase (GGDEF)-like protein
MEASRCPKGDDGQRTWQKWAAVSLPLLFLLVAECMAGGQSPDAAKSRLPLLTTAREAHGLTQEQGARGYPVRLHAVVTYYDADIDNRHGALFVQDATAGIFVWVPSRPVLAIHAGSVVVVSGLTSAADYAPIVRPAKIQILNQTRPSAKPLRVSLPYLDTGAEDAQLVEVEGMVHSVEQLPNNIVLTLATIDGPLTATTVKRPGVDYNSLVDSKVLLRGTAAPLFNSRREMTGVRLFFPDMSAITIEDPPLGDPMTLPVQPISGGLGYSPGVTLRHRVHLLGRLSLLWPGRMLCIQNGGEGLCMRTHELEGPRSGVMADVVGFPGLQNYEPTLDEAMLRATGKAFPVLPNKITSSQAFSGNHNAELVQIEGRVVGRSLVMRDAALLLSSEGSVFPAILPGFGEKAGGAEELKWPAGSRVLVTGVLLGQVDPGRTAAREGGARLESFQILLRSPVDVVVLERPSWWTGQHTLTILGAVLLLTLVVLVWVILLRRRVKQQTLQIRRSEERFRHLAEHDSLTGLVSRSLLHERLNEELESARRKQTPLALLMMDVDHFKQVNDSLGHAAGDEILRVTAQRIRAAVRETDTVARMSGDEFIVLLPAVRGLREAGKIAAQIVASVAAPVKFRGQEVPISVSVGISSYPDGGDDATSLLQNGDAAMYQAKSLGRNCYRFFTPDMVRAGANQLEFAVALNHALANHEFELLYQPLIDLRTGQVEGVEALLRWRNERWGIVTPADFIPVAEESGLIAAIGEWVLSESCRQVGQLEAKLNRKLLLAVNISPRQMQQGDLLRAVGKALSESHRAAGDLELEITESILIGNSGQTQETFQQLRALGVRLAIDDFGTGFANLSYITQFEVDRLKIDQSFIQHCLIERNSATVTRVIIAMAHRLEVSVVAEGVESAEQYRFLQEADCDLAQGYYLSKPLIASDLEKLLLTRRDWGPVRQLQSMP